MTKEAITPVFKDICLDSLGNNLASARSVFHTVARFQGRVTFEQLRVDLKQRCPWSQARTQGRSIRARTGRNGASRVASKTNPEQVESSKKIEQGKAVELAESGRNGGEAS
jgi:hypothetical protein